MAYYAIHKKGTGFVEKNSLLDLNSFKESHYIFAGTQSGVDFYNSSDVSIGLFIFQGYQFFNVIRSYIPGLGYFWEFQFFDTNNDVHRNIDTHDTGIGSLPEALCYFIRELIILNKLGSWEEYQENKKVLFLKEENIKLKKQIEELRVENEQLKMTKIQ